jgi:1,2-diacylglycerol 3-alpha-glucosyltransferase
VVYTNHTRYDLYAQTYLPFLPDTVSETALRAYLPAFCRACNLVISPSYGLRRVLVHLGVDSPIEVVPNGVDLTPFQKGQKKLQPGNLGIPEDHVILMYVGRLGPEKSIPFLLRAFSGVAQAVDTVTLVLVGEGPEREYLKELAAQAGLHDRVIFTGFVNYEELPGYVSIADAFVTASVTEVHPLSVIEALAAGLPVLGIASPGIEDSVVDGVNGYLTTNDISAFTAKMVLLVTNHEQRKKMGKEALQSAHQFDIRSTSKLLQQHYERLYKDSLIAKQGARYRIARFMDRWL